jgi:AcrR family transcriptional regulator
MGRNEQVNQQAKDERREQILSTALGLFAKKGLFATKISDITAAAGISQGLIYHYFSSKEEIFTTLIREAFTKMNAACRMLEAMPVAPREKIALAISELLKGLKQRKDTGLYYLLIAQATASESIPAEAKAIIRKENKEPYRVLARIFAEGQRHGVFKPDPPETLALVFWTSITGLSIYKAVHGERFVAPDPAILMRMFV